MWGGRLRVFVRRGRGGRIVPRVRRRGVGGRRRVGRACGTALVTAGEGVATIHGGRSVVGRRFAVGTTAGDGSSGRWRDGEAVVAAGIGNGKEE